MSNHLHNWTYDDVTEFLKENGFDFLEDVPGVGRAWMNYHINGEPKHMVEVKHTHELYTSRALKKMIRQSGIAEDEWLKWASS